MTENDYTGPTSQEPKPYSPYKTEPSKLTHDEAGCPVCYRPVLGYTHEYYDVPEIVGRPLRWVYVHPQKPNGLPDICRKG